MTSVFSNEHRYKLQKHLLLRRESIDQPTITKNNQLKPNTKLKKKNKQPNLVLNI